MPVERMADVDAVNERLNGLVTLLQAVGVGGEDVARMSKGLGKGGGGGDLGLPDARQLNDDQVEALIRKLQMAQSEAPQIIAALEAHAEARSLGGGQSRSGVGRRGHHQSHPDEEEEEEDDDDDEDEFDENANYPMVGHGCSDDISVVSDLTTPTVVSSLHVHEEEQYKDILPPMVIGGGPGEAPPMVIQPSKRKNLVNQVGRPSQGGIGGHSGGVGIAPPPRRNVPAPRSGGAAAARRKNYQSTMAKLHENPHSMGYAGPSGAPGGAPRKAPARKKSTEGSPPVKKRAPKPTAQDVGNFSELASSRAAGAGNNWESSANNNSNWDAFDSNPRPQHGGGGGGGGPRMSRRQSTGVSRKSSPGTAVDNDGFLLGDSFDPFNAPAASNPFKSSSAGDLAFDNAFPSSGRPSSSDGFDAFGTGPSMGGSAQPRPRKPKRPEGSGGSAAGGGQLRAPPAGSGRPKASAGQGRPRRARRASLAM